MHYTDYYTILGLNPRASEQDIRKAYRNLAKDYHPDTRPGDKLAEKKFKEVSEAYEVLGDRDKRSRYDQIAKNWNQYQDLSQAFKAFEEEPAVAETPSPNPPKVEDLRPAEPKQPEPEAIQADPIPEAELRQHTEVDSEIFDLNFSDFFETFFGEESEEFWAKHGPKSTSQPKSKKSQASEEPPTLEYTTEVSLEEVMTGTKRRIQIRENTELKTIEVKVPIGVKEGSKIRVNSETGQFALLIKLKPHPVFQVEGSHLRCQLRVNDYDALLGSTQTVKTLSAQIQMKIPAGAQVGQTFRIRGQGLPDLKHADQRGDLLVELDIKMSKNLSEQERDLIEQFRALRQQKSD